MWWAILLYTMGMRLEQAPRRRRRRRVTRLTWGMMTMRRRRYGALVHRLDSVGANVRAVDVAMVVGIGRHLVVARARTEAGARDEEAVGVLGLELAGGREDIDAEAVANVRTPDDAINVTLVGRGRQLVRARERRLRNRHELALGVELVDAHVKVRERHGGAARHHVRDHERRYHVIVLRRELERVRQVALGELALLFPTRRRIIR